MLKAAAKVCVVLFVVLYYLSEQCYALSINYENADQNDLELDEDLFTPETVNHVGQPYKKPVTVIPKQTVDIFLKYLLATIPNKDDSYLKNNRIDGTPKQDGSKYEEIPVQSRVIRQASYGQAPLYPTLPTSPPYNQYQPNPNYNNQNSKWQPTNNNSQHGYPSNGASNFYPATQQNSPYGHNPYNPSQGLNPYYNPHNPSVPGYKPPNNTFNNVGPSRPPYSQHGQYNNNTYPGYQTPGYQPGNPINPYNQRPPYSVTTPSNKHPVIYDHSSNRPSYNNQSSSQWPGNSGTNLRPPYNASSGQNPQYFNSYPNNPYGKPNATLLHSPPNQGSYSSNGVQNPAYNNARPYGQNAQNFNSFAQTTPSPYNNNAGGSPYGQNPQNFNSFPQTNQNPYNNPSNGQYAGGSNYNLSNNGYQPSPNQSPYGARPGQDNNLHYPPGSSDPTKVSPQHFSYPH